MAKHIEPSQIAKHITKIQGSANDTAFAKTLDITRQGLRTIKNGGTIPNVRTRAKLGLRLKYEIVPLGDPEAAKTATEVAAPKPAAKTAKKK